LQIQPARTATGTSRAACARSGEGAGCPGVGGGRSLV